MTKYEADYCKKIEVWWLLRDVKNERFRNKTITWGKNGSEGSIGCHINLISEPYVRFTYTQTDRSTKEKKDFAYDVPLIKTPCYFGGMRHWFKCSLSVNGQYCGRRVGVLYLQDEFFGCRHCHNLTYSSRNANKNSFFHGFTRIFLLREKLQRLTRKASRNTYKGIITKRQQEIDRLMDDLIHTQFKHFRREKALLHFKKK